jgi:3-hydroxyisobutyrate dehydrogenase
MGRPMVGNLLRRGFAVVAYDVDAAALAAAERLGAQPVASAAAAAAASDLVVTMLPSSPHVERAYLGEAGVAEGLTAGRLCVDMSTIDPGTARRLAARLAGRGARFLDAPVSGGVAGAEDGTLTIMVGGEAGDLDEARPALAAMGQRIVHVGPVGAGAGAKLCNNLIAGVVTIAVSEAFRIAEGLGLDPRVLTEVIAASSGRTGRRRPAD